MTQQTDKSTSTTSLLTGILIFVIGAVLIICNKMVTGHGVIVLAGILFLITGVINLVLYVTRRTADGQRLNTGLSHVLGWLVSVAAIILGLSMLFFETTFNSLIPFIFGVLVFFGALMLIINMLFGVRKLIKVPVWMWLFPFVIVVLGVIVITRRATVDDSLIMILTGASMLLFGLGAVVLGAMVSGAKRSVVKGINRNTDISATSIPDATHDTTSLTVTNEPKTDE